jgi:hypothetical protein
MIYFADEEVAADGGRDLYSADEEAAAEGGQDTILLMRK